MSARWRATESGGPAIAASVLLRTAATPPWAHWVADSDSVALVSTPIRNEGSVAAARTAADRPATPLPTTRRSSS